VAVVALLLVGGLVVLGLVAGIFFLRFSAAPQAPFPEPPRVVLEERPIMAEPEQAAEELTAERPVSATTETSRPDAGVRKITVQLDPQGTILADGQAVGIDGLKDLLIKAREDSKIRLEVVIAVDRQCVFAHVAAAQAVCKEVGVENVDVQASNAAPD
jgi:biopolymer transport protein ExbD